MARILCNFDVGSLYPNLVRLYGYSSRSQKDKNAYVNLLDMRMKAKHGKLSEDVLKPMGLTNDDLKTGLKLPLNAYTGTLRASFNKNADFKQGFGICTTGQLLILQLVYDLQKIPTLEMVSTNTDAVMFTIEEEYKPQVLQVIKDWEDLTGLEMEEDKIVKIVMRDVNSYCEIVQVGDNDFKVNYKGGEFKGKHKFKWNKEERIFEYSFDDEIEANSLTIVSEALLKKLLFDIPIEDTINNCNDIFRFQMITHLGGTYEKCVQESPNGDIELQRNNRIYASNGTSGTIIKVKPDGRRDSLALCPPNPIVDNKNECTIEDVNKSWYIKIANQKLNDFLGIKRLTEYKEANESPVTFEDLKNTLKMTLSAEKEGLDDFELTKVITEREDKGLTEDKIDSGDIDYITKYFKEFEYDVKPVEESLEIQESYVEDAEGEYTVWSASDLVKPEDQIPLVKIKTDEEGNLYAEAVGETELDKESLKIAQNVLDTAKKSGKSIKDTLIRLDKTLNHNDPFFSVEFDRSITNTFYFLRNTEREGEWVGVTALQGFCENESRKHLWRTKKLKESSLSTPVQLQRKSRFLTTINRSWLKRYATRWMKLRRFRGSWISLIIAWSTSMPLLRLRESTSPPSPALWRAAVCCLPYLPVHSMSTRI